MTNIARFMKQHLKLVYARKQLYHVEVHVRIITHRQTNS